MRAKTAHSIGTDGNLGAATCPVAIDLTLFTLLGHELSVLLIRRRSAPYPGYWALPGQLRQPGLAVDVQARQLLAQLAGDEEGWIEQLKTFDRPQAMDSAGTVTVPGRDPRGDVISVAYLAIVPDGRCQEGRETELAWKPVRRLPVEVAFDHREIIDYAVRRLRSKVGYSSIGFQLLPREFTITELQQVYEAVLGLSINRGNFWRKVVDQGVIERTGRQRSVRGRPADLYQFKQQAFGLREEPDGFITD